MKASELIALFERMLAEGWRYEWGAAREGVVDCSGAFVWAFGRFGRSIAHGSNTIARRHVSAGLRPAGEAKPGWAVFKRRFDGGEPGQYQGDGLGNFYHIGLLAADGKSVLNAKDTASGFSSDPLGKWDCAAPLDGVQYGEEAEMNVIFRAVVTTAKDPLNVRSAPDAGAAKLGSVPRGGTVDVLGTTAASGATAATAAGGATAASGDWLYIRYGALTGYASRQYLRRVDEESKAPATDAEAGQATGPVGTGSGRSPVNISRELAEQMYKALSEALSAD